jgi:electron transfer flavoprotein alpha subunit
MVTHDFEPAIVFSDRPEGDASLLWTVEPLSPRSVRELPADTDSALSLIEAALTTAAPPRVVVLPETERNTVLAGRAAAVADAPVIAAVREIAVDGEAIAARAEGDRPDLLDEWELPADRPAVLVVRATEPWAGTPRVVLSVGGGAATAEAVEAIRTTAEELGADLTCSRPVVERGLLPATHLVGVSGATVRPDLCITFGVSGAAPHLAGLRARRVGAVDLDPEAHVFRTADDGVAADAVAVAEALRAAWNR